MLDRAADISVSKETNLNIGERPSGFELPCQSPNLFDKMVFLFSLICFCFQLWIYIVGTKDLENGSEKAKVGSAGFLIELENRRAIKVCVHFMTDNFFRVVLLSTFSIHVCISLEQCPISTHF